MINLSQPIFYFGSLIALLIGAFIHLVAGGSLLRLIFSLVFALLGFWVGNYLGGRVGLSIVSFGAIDYGWSPGRSITCLVFGYWLSGESKKE